MKTTQIIMNGLLKLLIAGTFFSILQFAEMKVRKRESGVDSLYYLHTPSKAEMLFLEKEKKSLKEKPMPKTWEEELLLK